MINEKNELKKLNEIVSNMSDERKKLAEGLVENAAFMVEQLVLLQDSIRKNGVTEVYQHGANQSGTKQTVEVSTYLQMQKSYSVTIRALESFLPKQEKKNESDDELTDFLKGKKMISR